MLSVPRDLWVAIPGYGQERVNAAYELGGPQTAKQTISNVLGQPIDRYVVIGLQGVRDVVDAVGGVDITVPQAIHDATYPTDDYGYQVVDIPAGRQHMDGDTALKYARTRHQDSDFARTARQQQVVAAVRNAMLNPVNWPRLPAVAAALSTSIKTDISPLDAIALGAAVLRSPGDADHLVIDTSLANEVTGADGAYLLQPKPSLQQTVAQFLSHPSSTPLSVEVLNAAGIAGLAGRTADRLSQAGFTVANVADAPARQAQTSIAARPAARPPPSRSPRGGYSRIPRHHQLESDVRHPDHPRRRRPLRASCVSALRATRPNVRRDPQRVTGDDCTPAGFAHCQSQPRHNTVKPIDIARVTNTTEP